MKGWRFLLALGLTAFVLFAIVTLPARVVLPRITPENVSATGVAGSIWRGRAQALVVDGMRVGSVEWDLEALKLLTGRLAADLNVKRVDGFLQTNLSAAPSGRLRFEDLTGSLPLSALPPNVVRGGWTGTANLRLDEVVIEDGWPVEVAGVIQVVDVTGPASRPANIGSYEATFTPTDGPETVGQLKDLGGPLQIEGSVRLNPENRGYMLQGLVSTRPDAPREVVNALQLLGPPDELGRRPFGLEGTL